MRGTSFVAPKYKAEKTGVGETAATTTTNDNNKNNDSKKEVCVWGVLLGANQKQKKVCEWVCGWREGKPHS